MPRRKANPENLSTYIFDNVNDLPELNPTNVANNTDGLTLGETTINPYLKRLWVGMGRSNLPFELTNVIILNSSGETPNVSTTYNAGTLIVNTVDNLVWIGTGNNGTGNSFIPLNTNSNSVYVTGINLSTAGEILVSYSNGNIVNLGDVIELNDPNYPVDGGNFDLDGGEF